MTAIRKKLAKVTAIVEGWCGGDGAAAGCGVDALERDLALELLRDIYAAIKFEKTPCVEAEPKTEPEEPQRCSAPEAAEECSEAEPTPRQDPETRNVPEPETEPKEPQPDKTPEPDKAPEPAAAPEPVKAPRTVGPEIIRSLYGSDAPETIGDTLGAVKKQTLGETLGESRGQVRGETLRTTADRDLAATKCTSLRSAIGINDRFLMIRDMFGGDGAAFDECIATLDGFTDLDSAVIHIHDTYGWSADSAGAMRLVRLLESKLG
ncbi:MAG: hypothetical protein LBV18_00875 [Alistipes sp.]|jgi:hypothetical protein|nr:hypothetical protein [Alistipes sp.]